MRGGGRGWRNLKISLQKYYEWHQMFRVPEAILMNPSHLVIVKKLLKMTQSLQNIGLY